MTRASRLRAGWIYVKQYGTAVVAAGLMYAGIYQIISALKYPIANGILKILNAILVRGFRDRMPLPEYGWIPWAFHARVVAMGVIVIVVGLFVGLWTNSHQALAEALTPDPKQNPRRGEG
jgi:hypothetical protein